MRFLSYLFFSATFATSAALYAKAAPATPVTIQFVNPKNFTDAQITGLSQESSEKELLHQVTNHLENTARHVFKKGQHLHVAITDIDMAGKTEPGKTANVSEIRIIRPEYPPRVQLDYTLYNRSGAVVKQGTETLTSHTYLNGARAPTSDPGYSIEHMLDDWVRTL